MRMDEVLKKRRWIVRRRLEGSKVDEIASALRINEKTVDRWWRVYRKQGWAGLQIKSKRNRSYHRTPESTVASSNTTDRISETVKHFGMNLMLDAIVGIDEVEAGKPDPALVMTAIKKLAAIPKESIYVGDSRYDIEAGRAAGTQTALVLQPVAAQSELKVQPDYRLKSLYQLRRIIWPNLE